MPPKHKSDQSAPSPVSPTGVAEGAPLSTSDSRAQAGEFLTGAQGVLVWSRFYASLAEYEQKMTAGLADPAARAYVEKTGAMMATNPTVELVRTIVPMNNRA